MQLLFWLGASFALTLPLGCFLGALVDHSEHCDPGTADRDGHRG